MRLTLAGFLLLSAAPALAGDLLVTEPASTDASSRYEAGPATAPSATAEPAAAPNAAALSVTAPIVLAAPSILPAAPPTTYAAIYEAPVFGHATGASAKVDESALRYYAGQKNRVRVEAEIKRLRDLHPTWKPPANLYATGSGNDEQPLWDLFGAGRMDELRSAIQVREKKEAGWRPSADLLTKMAHQEAAVVLIALSKSKEWTRLLDDANAHAEIFTCSTIDLDWRVAEAFAGIGLLQRAFEVDAAILSTCKNRDERLATVRKAVELLASADVEKLIAMGQPLADGSGEFDAVKLDLARQRLGRVLAGTDHEEVPKASLDALGQATLQSSDPADAALLGWYAFGHERWAEADAWFKLGLAGSGGDGKLAEGHALALGKLGRFEEAEKLAFAWRERSTLMRSLFIGFVTDRLGKATTAAIDPAELADFTALITADRSLPGAQAIAWAGVNHKDWDAAVLWFGHAIDWAGPGDATGPAALPEKVIEGYALALKSLGRFEDAETFTYRYRETSAAARDQFVAVAIAALAASVPGSGDETSPVGPYGPVLPVAVVSNVADAPLAAISAERMDRFAEAIRAAQSAPGATAMGWRSLRDNRPSAAVDWFNESITWSGDHKGDLKTLEGLVLALKNAGRLPEAEDVSFAHIAESAQLRDAYRSIMVAQLVTPALADLVTHDRLERFAALVEAEHLAEGAQAIGWYRLQDHGCGYGTAWFRKSIDWSADHRGTAKANEGYAQALQRSGDVLSAAEVAFDWSSTSADMKALYIEIMVDAITRDHFAPRVTEPMLDRFSDVTRTEHSFSGAQALAWHRYHDAGNGYGVEWFADAVAWSPDRQADAKTIEGYASALRDVGRLGEAEDLLFPWVERVAVMRDIYIDTVVSELTLDNPPEPMPHDRLARFIAVATPLRSAAAAQALGWYRYARHEYADSAIWFKFAVDWWPTLPPDADRFTFVPEGYRPLMAHLALKPEDYRRTPRAFSSLAHDRGQQSQRYVDTFGGFATTWTGYALALHAVGRTAEAEDVAYAWRDRWPALGRLFLDLAVETLTQPGNPAVDPERLKRYAAVIEERHDPAGAAALGWSASAHGDWNEATVWLKASTDWRAPDTAPDAKVVAGYVDALRQAGRYEEALVVATSWQDRVPTLKAGLIETAIALLGAAGDAAHKNPGDAAAVLPAERLAEVVAIAKADTGARGTSALGWFYYNSGQPASALPWFKIAVNRAADSLANVPAPTTVAVPATGDGSPGGLGSAAGSDPATLPGPAATDVAVLSKAVEGFALTLRALGRDADAVTFVSAWGDRLPGISDMLGDVVADLLGHTDAKAPLTPDLLARLSAAAEKVRSVSAASAFGWYDYAHRDWAGATTWFGNGLAWSPDQKGSVKVVEGYAASLHNQCRFGEAETAAASRMDDDASGALRRIYVDSVSDRLARQKAGVALAPDEAERLAASTLASQSANGAQALGWYAYRSRQFPAAVAWFGKSVGWGATEGNVFGLALAYRRNRDSEGLARLLSVYGSRFRSLESIQRAGLNGADPAVPDFGNLTHGGCAPAGAPGPLRPSVASNADLTDASALLVPTAAPLAGRWSPAATVTASTALPPAVAPQAVASVEPSLLGPVASDRPAQDEQPAMTRSRPRPLTVHPRLEDRPEASDERRDMPEERRRAPETSESSDSRAANGAGGHSRSGSAAAALAAKDYTGCLAILDRRGRSMTSDDRGTEGWCLLGLERPAEAAVAFKAAQAGGSGRIASDSALGETLSHLRNGDTEAAVDSASRTSLDAEKRRTLGVQIISQKAYDAYRDGRWQETIDFLRQRAAYASETRDLLMLRGWSLYHLGDYDSARRVFTTADQQISDAASRQALATVTTAADPRAYR